MIVIQPVVGGHGEVSAVRVLLRRVIVEVAPGIPFKVLRPWRTYENRIFNQQWAEFDKAAGFARNSPPPTGLFVLLDTDGDRERCPATVAPTLLAEACRRSAPVPVRLVMANAEYETWFLAAAESIVAGAAPPPRLEEIRNAKGAVAELLQRPYVPAVDQARLTEQFDLALARTHSPSFDKLWRDVESLARELAGV